jgi:hypothetical protein
MRTLVALAAIMTATSSLAGFQLVDRPDPMHNHMLAHSDMRGDTVRVAYMSMPSRVQAAGPDWTVSLYVAELDADGGIRNHRVLSGKRYLASAILRQGHDGIFVMPSHENQPGEPHLEVYPATGGGMAGSFRSSLLGSGAFGQQTIFPTSDGNFFSALTSAQSGNHKGPNTLTWTKLSPSGAVLGQGSFSRPTAETYPGGAFPARDGGMGMTLMLRTAKGATSLQTDLPTPIVREVGGRRLEAQVFSETLMLTTDNSGAKRWLSPTLERTLMWEGEMAVPTDLPPNQMLAQSNEQLQVMAQTVLDHHGDRQIVAHSHIQLHQVRPTSDGYGMLVQQTADRRLEPPQHGTFFIEIGLDGTLLREIYLQPAADLLEAKFDRFLPTSDGGVLVAGSRDPKGKRDYHLHVTALNANGDIEWTARLKSDLMELHDIGGSPERPWAFGHGWNDDLGNERDRRTRVRNPHRITSGGRLQLCL